MIKIIIDWVIDWVKYNLFLLLLIAILSIVIMAVVFIPAPQPDHQKNDILFGQGKITEKEWCMRNFRYATSGIPAACFKYFSIEPAGDKCDRVGKTVQCQETYRPTTN